MVAGQAVTLLASALGGSSPSLPTCEAAHMMITSIVGSTPTHGSYVAENAEWLGKRLEIFQRICHHSFSPRKQ